MKQQLMWGNKIGGLINLCFTLLLINNEAAAQPSELPYKNIIFEQPPDNLGLSQSSINCILQDSDGYLWIGTWSGLIQYDGYTTKTFYSDNAPGRIKSNKITCIYEDSDGHLWVGTHMGGLFRYDKNSDKFTHYKSDTGSSNSLSNNNVWAVLEDDDKNLWIATEQGLNYFNKKENSFTVFRHTLEKNSLSYDFVTNLYRAANGDIWIATERGLNKLVVNTTGERRKYSFENYFFTEDPANNDLHNYIYQVSELTINGTSSVWFSTKKGLKRYQQGQIKNYQYVDKPSSFNFFRSFFIVREKNPYILVGSEMGLNFFDPLTNRFVRSLGNVDEKVNLSHTTITSFHIDRGGVLWVGTKKGLNKFDSYSKEFEMYLSSSYDPTNSIITGIQSSSGGRYWISTIGGGLFRFMPGQKSSEFTRYKIISKSENDFTDFIQTIYADSKGRVWVGTAGDGAFSIAESAVNEKKTIREYEHYNRQSPRPLSDDYIMCFAEDKGGVWIGTWSGGLNKVLHDGKVITYSDSLIKDAPIVVLHADNSGILWVGTRGNGVYRIRQRDLLEIQHFKYDPAKNSICNNFINTIFEDHAGGLWFGTEGGLAFFDRRTETFEVYSIAERTGSNAVVSILEDDAGKLWLANWDGITVFDPSPAERKVIRNYDSHDRIQGGFYFNNVCYKDDTGRLFFGGSNGFNIIDPGKIGQSPFQPKIVIKDFRIFNKRVVFGETFNDRVILDQPLDKTNHAVLKYFENSILFEFAALDYAAPEKIRYAYKLEGFDQDWNYTDASRRYANYTNLADGSYTFRVRSTNSDGVWGEEESVTNVTILAPWWKTPWAFVLYAVFGLTMFMVLAKLLLMRANLLHDIKLERVQRENMEKLNRAKLEFFTNISHEFRTPLTLILGPVQNLLDLNEGGKFIRSQLLIVHNNAQRLLRLVNQLLDFRKAESGNMKLQVFEGNIVRFIKEIKLSFDALAEQMKIDFSFRASSNVIKVWYDRDEFEKIIFNLLSNAFKNTPEGGKISIDVIESKNHVSIIVEDNGKGIKSEHFDQLFQTFFSYDQDKHHTGTGIGLALTKSLVDLHHGEIRVESKENEYSRFIVTIPVGNDHFDESELASSGKGAENVELYSTLNVPIEEEEGKAPAITNLKDLSKILIVEDNAEVRSYLRSFFVDKYIVLEAEEGKEGLDIALEEAPDLIISDVMMPVMDGIALCRQLKSNVKTSHIPVVLLTARTSLIFKVEGLETGADDYITKPFNPRLLVLKVQNLLRSREAMQRIFHSNEPLVIEPKRVTLNSTDELFIQRALESVEKNMSNADYSVEDFGHEVGMSRTQLYRKLKGLTGQSPNEFIRTIRLRRAAQLLEQRQCTVAEITYEVGFTDLQYFRDCFKKLFGATPTEYMNKKTDSRVEEGGQS